MTAARLTLATAAALAVALSAAACSTETVGDGKAEHRTFTLHGKTLTVDANDNALQLVPVDRSTKDIRVTRWFKAKKWKGKTRTSWSMHGSTLRLKTTCSGVVVDCDSRYRVEVPRGVAVNVDGHDGSIRAAGFTTKLSIRSADGSIHVTDATGLLDLESADGSISATGLTSDRVRASSQDGSIHLAFTEAPSRLTTHSQDGSTAVDLPRASYAVDADAQDGGVSVKVPRDGGSPHRVQARSQDGSITIRPS